MKLARRESPIDRLRLLWPGLGGERLELYRNALREGAARLHDALTVRDLLRLSQVPGELPLEAALLALFQARREGSLCLPLGGEELEARIEILAPERGTALAEAFRKRLAEGAYGALVADLPEAYSPLLVCADTGGGRNLYFERAFRIEERLKIAFRRLLVRPVRPVSEDAEAMLAAVRAVAEERPVLLPRPDGTEAPMDLTGLRGAALGAALLSDFLILTGGPGTGKTSLLIAALRCFLRLGYEPPRIRLAAPTGRAACRLTEALHSSLSRIRGGASREDAALLQLEGETLHRLLGYSPGRNDFLFGRENPLPADLLVVDEVSMVDAELMARFAEAVGPRARVILLGDEDQLPSVEAGAVLADLLPRGAEPGYSREYREALGRVVPGAAADEADADGAAHPLRDRTARLKGSLRSTGPIARLADAIREGGRDIESNALLARLPWEPKTLPLFLGEGEAGEGAGAPWLDPGEGAAADWQRLLAAWTERFYLLPSRREPSGKSLRRLLDPFREGDPEAAAPEAVAALFSRLRQAVVLTAVRSGPFGCEGANAAAARLCRMRCAPTAAEELFDSAPVLVTRNRHDLGLFNGDRGVAVRRRDGSCRLLFERSGPEGAPRCRAVAPELLPGRELAYALTVHKSQGSEFERLLLVLPPDPAHALLTREILYTGLTRARRHAALCATEPALAAALSRRLRRHSGFDIGRIG